MRIIKIALWVFALATLYSAFTYTPARENYKELSTEGGSGQSYKDFPIDTTVIPISKRVKKKYKPNHEDRLDDLESRIGY